MSLASVVNTDIAAPTGIRCAQTCDMGHGFGDIVPDYMRHAIR